MYSAVLQHIEELHVLQYGDGNDEMMSMKAGDFLGAGDQPGDGWLQL